MFRLGFVHMTSESVSFLHYEAHRIHPPKLCFSYLKPSLALQPKLASKSSQVPAWCVPLRPDTHSNSEQNEKCQSGIAERICNPSSGEAEAKEWLQVQDQSELYNKFQVRQGYRMGLSERRKSREIQRKAHKLRLQLSGGVHAQHVQEPESHSQHQNKKLQLLQS